MHRGKLKAELLYHDLKGPLSVIKTGITSLLNKKERYGALTAQQEKVLQRVLRNSHIAQSLVDDTLEIGRSEAGITTVKHIKLSALISEILLEISDLTNIALSTKILPGQPLEQLKKTLKAEGISLSMNQNIWDKEFSVDEIKVKQILRNLLLNALKYKNNFVALEVAETKGDLFFSVMDDGKGIPPEYHAKIFKKYFQLDDAEKMEVRGHGLGLAGVQILVEDMGGKLSLESEVEKGAKFMVHIPIAIRPTNY
jgi:signal transduction histidine kinase